MSKKKKKKRNHQMAMKKKNHKLQILENISKTKQPAKEKRFNPKVTKNQLKKPNKSSLMIIKQDILKLI